MDAIAPILFWSCIVGAFGVPALIVAKLYMYGASVVVCRWSVLAKSAVAFIYWCLVTVLLTFFWAFIGMSFFDESVINPAAKWHLSPGLIMIDVSYLLLGCGLVYWVWRKETIELP